MLGVAEPDRTPPTIKASADRAATDEGWYGGDVTVSFACGDALSGALMNAGPIIHPPLITMNAAPLEHFERWDIHKEGTQPATRRVTDALDAERIAVLEMRKRVSWYSKRMHPCRMLKEGMRQINSAAEFDTVLKRFLEWRADWEARRAAGNAEMEAEEEVTEAA